MPFETQTKAEIAVAVSAAFWGLYWIPIRALEAQGLPVVWVILAQFIGPVLCMVPFIVYRLQRGKPVGIRQFYTGLFIGGAFCLYSYSLLMTEVVRALILFYVMPAWGTILEVMVMGRRFTRWRAIALALSLTGLAIIVGLGGGSFEDTLTWFRFNAGDGVALAAGIAFSFGVMRVRQSPDVSPFEQTFAFFFFGGLVALLVPALPSFNMDVLPVPGLVIQLLPWLLGLAFLYLLPVMWMLYWGSRHVDPGRLGLLLQLEVVVGIFSAALFAGEIFGWREALGTFLVVSAGLVEVLGYRKPRPA